MYPNKCSYIISGFIPPHKDSIFGGYGFSVGLTAEFAKRCLTYKINDKEISYINNIGLEISKNVFSYADRKPYYFDELNNEQTLLLKWVMVPGNACDIGNGEIEPVNILEMDNDKFIEYCPHNVDSMQQSYLLLSLWLEWYKISFSLINLTK